MCSCCQGGAGCVAPSCRGGVCSRSSVQHSFPVEAVQGVVFVRNGWRLWVGRRLCWKRGDSILCLGRCAPVFLLWRSRVSAVHTLCQPRIHHLFKLVKQIKHCQYYYSPETAARENRHLCTNIDERLREDFWPRHRRRSCFGRR